MAYFLLFVGILVVLSIVWKVVINASWVDLPKLNNRYRDCNRDEGPITDEPERPKESIEPSKPTKP